MIKEERRRTVKKALTRLRAAETSLDTARDNLINELKEAHENEKSSFGELGELVGLSRQRIHQMLQ